MNDARLLTGRNDEILSDGKLCLPY